MMDGKETVDRIFRRMILKRRRVDENEPRIWNE